MMAAEDFIATASQAGIRFFAGVPCSFLTPLMNAVIASPHTRYVGATSEGEAVAIAAGAWLAGRQTAVMCQNSGLGNAVNPLTSLNWPFRIPTLLIVTWRGQPGLDDEPQHELMGEITARLLDTIRVRHAPFPASREEIAAQIGEAAAHMAKEGLPFALIQPKGAVADAPLRETPLQPRQAASVEGVFLGGAAPKRIAVLERIVADLPPKAALIATTGYCGRELHAIGDHDRNLYVVGAMGGASAIGLGAALNCDRDIVVLDGDGAALMKLGNLATIGAERPGNLTHIVLDNGMHESTGGQMTVSAGVDFAAVAAAAGYAHVARADDLQGVDAALATAFKAEGPRLLHVRVSPSRVARLGRPKIPPREVARRFQAYLTDRAA